MAIDDARVDKMLGMLPPSLFSADRSGETKRIAKGILSCWERIRQIYRYYRDHVSDLNDPLECPDDFIEYLAGKAGFDFRTKIPQYATTEQLRMLTQIAFDLWKEKGTTEGIKDSLIAITGREPWIVDWQTAKYVVGVDYPPYLWVSGADAYDSFCWIQDAYGTLDRDLIYNLINAFRRCHENVNIGYAEIVETWAQGLSQWTAVAYESPPGTPTAFFEVEKDQRRIHIYGEAEAYILPNLTGTGSWSGNFRLMWRLNWNRWYRAVPYDTQFTVYYLGDGLAGGTFRIQMTQNNDNTVLIKGRDPLNVEFLAETLVDAPIERDHIFELDVSDTGTSFQHKLYVDGNLILNGNDSGAWAGRTGTFRMKQDMDGGGGVFPNDVYVLSPIIYFQKPAETAIVPI